MEWFVITSLISDQKCTTRSVISTLLLSFWNLNFKQFCKTETVLFYEKYPLILERVQLSLNHETFYQKNEEIYGYCED